MIAFTSPIWKDYYVKIWGSDWGYSADSGIEYYITADNREIYRGVAHLRPGRDSIEIRINDICADYLYRENPEMIASGVIPSVCPVFKVWANTYPSSSTFTPLEYVTFYPDWSYDNGFDPEIDGMSFPINGKVDSRQRIYHTIIGKDVARADITLADGKTFYVLLPVSRYADFNEDFNEDYDKTRGYNLAGTAVFDIKEYGEVRSVKIGNVTYDVLSGCDRYALYYVNAHGGWDSLLIEGNHFETDSLVRYTREMEYDNRSAAHRGKENYVNEISRKMTLHTSWMTDDESSRMHHLLNSTQVYLFDMVEQKMIPVILDNTTTEHKTFKTNGNRLVNYTIEVSYANTMIRR